MDPIYLDYNATTPIAPEVADAMEPFLRGQFGNPTSGHSFGRAAREAVERARAQVAALLGCDAQEVLFTSGGTESNNLAIIGVVEAHDGERSRVITSAVEHPAVTRVCRFLAQRGHPITVLPVDETGQVDPLALESTMGPDVLLVTVMHANNEVGTLQPVPELARVAREGGALVHSDAAQSVGKVSARVDELGVDLLSVAGHKLYAPKGIGALYVREGTPLARIVHGAGQERGLRPGTENVLEIVGLGQACELCADKLEATGEHYRVMRDRLHEALVQAVGADGVRLNGHPERRLPNTLSLCFRGVNADALLAAVSDQVAASAGAACHQGGVEISEVLRAMNVPQQWARGTVRFSVGRETTEAQIDQAVEVVARGLGQVSA
ncbi:MAG: cysteine desulfurase [Deltaproteobacteria bacterium]|nr:cysteine desulfurase [Deltaproteobacteria bacterium]